jgi:hypothetical protein
MRKHSAIFAIVILFLFGCSNEEEVVTGPQRVSDLKDSFSLHHLKKFTIDTLSWSARRSKYKELDSTSFHLIWQGTMEYENAKGSDEAHFFYSWQTLDTNYTELTILSQTEEDWCDKITYLIYNKQGILVDQFVTNASCGDGGWTFFADGEFVNSRTYKKLCVETDENEEASIMQGDSALYEYTINSSGRVVEKQIYNRKFAIQDTINISF